MLSHKRESKHVQYVEGTKEEMITFWPLVGLR